MFDLHIAGGLARLVLNRPEARNAIPFSGWAELAAAVQQAEAAGAHMLIVSGAPGGSFCAGADMAGFHAFANDPDARTAFRLAIRQGLDALRDTPLPTLAVVEGHCYGAGVALAMACDTRFGGFEAEFAITPAKFGISYPQEDVHRLVALVGPGEAARLLFGAQAIGSREAVRIGLLDRAFDANVATGVDEFVKAVVANDPASLRTLKRGIRLAMAGVASDAEQDRAFDDLLGSETLSARLAARRK
jgi:enoyl-CoA hydratase/carnithine racemase